MGILLGAHWAYAVLGWGGYWGWDPVENASLLPWLTGTAFLHSVMMQEKRGMMKVWNVWLVFITFMLCILGTLLTRSGVVSSVHAFAQSSIGNWFVGFLCIVLGVCLAAYFKNKDYLKSENQLDSLVSRESSFLFNNLVLLVACVAVLSGTLFPVFSEWFTGSRISVGAPFFNKVNIPLGLMLLFLTGVGPLLAWQTSHRSMRQLSGPLAGLIGAFALAFGVRVFADLFHSVHLRDRYDCGSSRGARVVRAGRGILARVLWIDVTQYAAVRRHIVHLGMGDFHWLAGQAFNKEVEKELPVGSTISIGKYDLLLQSMDQKPEKNYVADRMIVEVMKDQKPVMMLYPERRNFPGNQESGTMVAIYSTLKEDLYVVYAGMNPQTNLPTVHAFINPLVKWVWWGGMVVVMGTIVALVPNRAAVVVLARTEVPSGAREVSGIRPAQVTLREGHD
jgi:cytochrome c-type biogenesis protein CcmF